MLRVYFQIFKKLYQFTNLYHKYTVYYAHTYIMCMYVCMYVYIYTHTRTHICLVYQSGETNTKVSVEGCNTDFIQ